MRFIDLWVNFNLVYHNSLRYVCSGSIRNKLKRELQPAHVPVIVKISLPRHFFAADSINSAPFDQQKSVGSPGTELEFAL